MNLGDAHALAIGISSYRLAPALPPVSDAEDVAAVLGDPRHGGYPAGNVRTLLEAAATRAAILDALDAIARETTERSTVFVYFSGHGGRIAASGADTCYLIPVDGDTATPDALAGTAISAPELAARLRAITAARFTLVLDCCRASGIAEPRGARTELASAWTPAALSPLAQGRGRAVLAASRADGYAYVLPGQRNGIFTRHLLDGLRGAAVGAGGVIRVCDLYHYVQQRVVDEHADQRPVFKAELEDNYPVARYHGGAPPALVLGPPPDALGFDAFVTHARADRAWVETVMVPRLEGLGLRLCLERRDFRLGMPRIREIERAVTESRYTIAVLTPSYLEGAFEEFQALLGQHHAIESKAPRFLPLLRRDCRPPLGVRMTELLDASDELEVDAALQRLALRLREPPHPGAGR
jgi:hypothetical protein